MLSQARLTVALITLAVSNRCTVTSLRHRHLHTYTLALTEDGISWRESENVIKKFNLFNLGKKTEKPGQGSEQWLTRQMFHFDPS